MEPVTQIVHKQRSFMATVAWGISLVAVTGIICASALALYGLRIVNDKSETLVDLVRSVAENVPELREALPTIIDDAFRDERHPEYRQHLETSGSLQLIATSDDAYHPVVRVKNTGDQTVSMLSLHVTVWHDEVLLFEYNVWAATPIACDRESRGPLLPESERALSVGHGFMPEDVAAKDMTVKVEISEVRLWTPNPADGPAGEKPEMLSEVEKPGGCDHAPK